jgi:hypothetical protein
MKRENNCGGGQWHVMKCRICGKLYEFHSFMVGDQTVCPECRAKASAWKDVK